ncbi:hypothetical protein LOC67_20240 [Stieleria sp. JC731]|uniref:hypothetical protein n=1 Tax=Pirellulaceae TaxID=2691357 RepID=UPI001E57FB33|nr:hypothetical protein [Stieleria sp. JC731]MCC9602886.1 hypothetical protein [Stieleria sp. JC731]
MAKKKQKATRQLLRWSKSVPASEVQDPLGLGLRGSTRLASRLMFCITSITPRARYFSYIPWCIYNFQKYERGQAYALGLRDAIKLREAALTLACVLHHEGHPCDGGGLVGSNKASNWKDEQGEANFKKLNFAKVPAMDAYYNSLVNLGCFISDEQREAVDEEAEDLELTFDDIELSPLGLELAKGYDSLIGKLESVRSVSTRHRKCSVNSLREWGKRGGLCELTDSAAPDQPLLQDMFFGKSSTKENSHSVRNRSLVLILELCRQLSTDEWSLTEEHFGMATYYGEVVSDEGDRLGVEWPNSIQDIALRWRMFYFHHFMAVALEGMFSWLVTNLSDKGIGGATTDELSSMLNEATVNRELNTFLDCNLSGPFGKTMPAEFFNQFGINITSLDEEASQQLDEAIRPASRVAEHWLEEAIRNRRFLYEATGLAVPMILFALTLGRFRRWSGTDHGNWLATAANDPYLDLVPPVVSLGLERHFGQWFTCSWCDLASFVLSRYVVQQHQAMAYEKTAKGDRCLIQVDGQKVITDHPHEKIGIGNPRMVSGVQILTDLALMTEDDGGITHLTEQGQDLLQAELNERGAQ